MTGRHDRDHDHAPRDEFPFRDVDGVGWDETLWEDERIDVDPDVAPWDDDPALRSAALEQRFVHAALRARHEGAAAHEARIERILAALPATGSGSAAIGPSSGWSAAGPWLSAAAAALVLAVLGYVIVAGDTAAVPRLDAAVLREVSEGLDADDVDRLYDIEVREQNVDGDYERIGSHRMWVRPGGRFRIEFDGRYVGKRLLMCNGRDVWHVPEGDSAAIEQLTGPNKTLDEVRSNLDGPFRRGGFFDLGYIHLTNAVRTLVGSHDIRCTRHVTGDPVGRFVFEADDAAETAFGRVHDVMLSVTDDFDEVDSMRFRVWCRQQEKDFELLLSSRGVVTGADIVYGPR